MADISDPAPPSPHLSDLWGQKGFINDESIPADGRTLVAKLNVQDMAEIVGQLKSDNGYDVVIEWYDDTTTVMRTEVVVSGAAGGSWSDFNVDTKWSLAKVFIRDNSGGSGGTGNGSTHAR